jgi:hypothetical protein
VWGIGRGEFTLLVACRLEADQQARTEALSLDLKKLPPWRSKQQVTDLRKKPDGLDLSSRLEALLATPVPPGVTDEQLVSFASMLGVSMEVRHLEGALVSQYATLSHQ